jgi:peptidoglycan hydrolase-like protein with peptidoglycan-binding domain
VSTLAFLEQKDQFARAGILSSRREITRLQNALNATGYYRGPADGRYTPDLRLAIERFEAGERRPRTGLASTQTLRRLEAIVAGVAPQDLEPATVETGSLPHTEPTSP